MENIGNIPFFVILKKKGCYNMSRTKSKNGNGQGSIFFNKSKNIWVGQYTVYGKRKTLYQRSLCRNPLCPDRYAAGFPDPA